MNSHVVSLLLLVAGLIPGLSHAQLTVRPQVSLGLSTQSLRIDGESPGEYDIRTRPRPAIEVGLTGAYPIREGVEVYTGMLFQTRGSQLRSSHTSGSVTEKVTETIGLSYLEIPLGVSVHLLPEQGLWVEGGLGIGVALGGNIKQVYRSSNGTDSYERSDQVSINFDRDLGYGMRRGDLRFHLGARLKPTTLPLEVGARLSLSLSDSNRQADASLRNSALMLFATWPISIP
ncbi:MAG: PorT family protein [Bacteroidetes bacterium]|nr:MAG: PorT family protein [Bacteroidota bacterium]